MRIAILSWESLHSIRAGGLAVHVTELASALARQGAEVQVFTRGIEGQDINSDRDGVRYSFSLMRSDNGSLASVSAFNKDLTTKVAAAGNFDILHAHDWLTVEAFANLLGKSARGVLSIHSTEFGRCGNVRQNSGDSSRIAALEHRGLEAAHQVIAVSYALKQELAAQYGVPSWKVEPIYNGCNVHEFDDAVDVAEVRQRHGLRADAPLIFFGGRNTIQKGPDLLVEAMPLILAKHPQAQFAFSSGGDMESSLRARAAALGAGDKCHFLGMLPRQEFTSLMRACDLVAIPSRNEPFGIVVLEAWAAGKPVVVTHVGGPEEYVTHEVNGLKTYVFPESIAWGVNELLSNPARAHEMGRNGRILAENAFTWDLAASATINVYARALNKIR